MPGATKAALRDDMDTSDNLVRRCGYDLQTGFALYFYSAPDVRFSNICYRACYGRWFIVVDTPFLGLMQQYPYAWVINASNPADPSQGTHSIDMRCFRRNFVKASNSIAATSYR